MRKKEIDRKFDEIVEFSGVEKFLDTPVKRYSSGMKVRLAFSVAAHLEPEILVVDEVLAVGDLRFQNQCLGKMNAIAHSGRTVLFVSHNMSAVKRLCHRALTLENGAVSDDGNCHEVISRYFLANQEKADIEFEISDAEGYPLRLRFLDSRGTPCTAARIHEPWSIELTFQIRAETQHVIAAVGLLTTQGTSLITYWSQPDDLSMGCYTVRFLCDLPLKSTAITFSVGLSSFEQTFYYKHEIGHFDILPISIETESFRATSAGLFHSDNQRPQIKRLSEYESLPPN
jgi:lipopolysaccharide transport system ATP-binding protein